MSFVQYRKLPLSHLTITFTIKLLRKLYNDNHKITVELKKRNMLIMQSSMGN